MDVDIVELGGSMDEKMLSELLDSIALIDSDVFGDSRWGRASFEENAVSNDYDCLMAALTDEGKVAGYGLLRMFEDAELIMIASEPRSRQKGIGGKILNNLILKARECGCGSIFLEVRESNKAARSMYEHAGFETEGVRKRYYHDPVEDAVIMRFSC